MPGRIKDSQNNRVFERVVAFFSEPHCTFYPMDGSIPANDEYEKSVADGKPWSQDRLLDEMKSFEDQIKDDLLTGKSPPLCADCKPGQL